MYVPCGGWGEMQAGENEVIGILTSMCHDLYSLFISP